MSDRTARMREGFTVIELMVALAILSALVAIAVPTMTRLQLKAKTAEAKLNLAAIRTAESIYYAEHGLFVGASPTPAAWTPRSNSEPFISGGVTDFDRLGFRPEGQVYFQYAVHVDPNNPSAYLADALGDIDGDGRRQIWGYVHPDPGGNVVSRGTLGCAQVQIGTSTDVRDTVGPCGAAFGESIF